MRPLPPGRLALAVAGLVALAAAVGLASRADVEEGARADLPSGIAPVAVDYLVAFALVWTIVCLVLFAWAVRERRRIGDYIHPARRPAHWSVKLAAALMPVLFLTALIFALGAFARARRENGGSSDSALPPPLAPVDEATPDVDPVAFGVVGGLALVALAALAVLLRRENAKRTPRRHLPGPEVAAAISWSLDELERERDPRRAVIAAYARMERALGAAGLPRRPPEAPLEYVGRALRDLRVRETAVHRLTDLFERAKFSRHRIDDGMKRDAIGALTEVRDDLEAEEAEEE